MGCGCNKSKQAVISAVSRTTIYQVLDGQTVVGEFSSLSEARAKAVAVSGRVKVTSKTNT